MTLPEVMSELRSYGNEGIKKILQKHGVKEPFFGVKVEYLKVIQKKIKKDTKLANELFATNNADAMYLAGLIADDEQMTRKDLQTWAALAVSDNISGYTVPWVAAGSRYGYELGMEWIDAKEEHVAVAGWATLGGLTALKPDSELDLPAYQKLLTRIQKNIHKSPDRIGAAMNNFIIAVGTFSIALTKDAVATAEKIGTVTIHKGDTACKVPDALTYINKAAGKNTIGKKKKTLKC